MIIAIDGPTASGKGTIAKALAGHFRLPHLDTGLLYRAVGWQVALASGNPDDPADALAGTAFPEHLLDDPALRSEETGALASRVLVHPTVRAALLARQDLVPLATHAVDVVDVSVVTFRRWRHRHDEALLRQSVDIRSLKPRCCQ